MGELAGGHARCALGGVAEGGEESGSVVGTWAGNEVGGMRGGVERVGRSRHCGEA